MRYHKTCVIDYFHWHQVGRAFVRDTLFQQDAAGFETKNTVI